MLCLSYYCLYSLFNKIRDKDRTDSAWKRGGMGGERWGGGQGEEVAQTMYAHINKWEKKNISTLVTVVQSVINIFLKFLNSLTYNFELVLWDLFS
jgi:hypothetical protein